MRVPARSWFWRRRVVSEAMSMSVSPSSLTKPATSTRRNRVTSILLWSGVSTGTSTTVAQPVDRRPARSRLRVLRLVLAVSLVIGFPEQVVVLLDVEVPGLELQGLLEGLAGLRELSLLLERDSEIVEGLGVLRVEGHRTLEAEAGLAPEAPSSDLDPEGEVLLGSRRDVPLGGSEKKREDGQDGHHVRLLGPPEY